DFGAARMFYGNVAAVYDDPKFAAKFVTDGADKKPDPATAFGIAFDHMDDFAGLIGYDGAYGFHYTQLIDQAGLIQNCKPVQTNAYKPVNWDDNGVYGRWNSMFDGHIVTDESGTPTRCGEPKLDFVRWDDLTDYKKNIFSTNYHVFDKNQ